MSELKFEKYKKIQNYAEGRNLLKTQWKNHQKSSEMVLDLLRFRLVLLFQWLCSFLSCFSNKITVFWGGLKAENTSSDEYFSRTPFWCVAAGHAAFKSTTKSCSKNIIFARFSEIPDV